MNDQGMHTPEIRDQTKQFEAFYKDIAASASDTEGDGAAEASQQTLGRLVVRVRGEAKVGNPRDLGVRVEVARDLDGVGQVSFNAERERFH